VHPRQFQPDYWGPPSVLRRAIGDARWTTIPIELAWDRSSPRFRSKQQRAYFYPVPLCDAFWLDYAEPVGAFLEAATLLSEPLQNLDAELPVGDDADAGMAEQRRREAHQALFSFLAGRTPALTDERTAGSRTRAFHSKSLLASLAMMACLDRTIGKRVLLCGEDGRPFVSRANQARYCSAAAAIAP
jgi:hypothetical protein